MFLGVQKLTSLTVQFYKNLLIRYDIVVSQNNVVINNKPMVLHLLLILFTHFYGIVFLELEATGTVNWTGLWNSPYFYTYQLSPSGIHRQINQVISIGVISQILIFLAYIFVPPIKKQFLLITNSDEFLTIIIKNESPLNENESKQILRFRKMYKRLLLSSMVIVSSLSLVFFYTNVFINEKYVFSIFCLFFFWGFQFPLAVFYIYFCK